MRLPVVQIVHYSDMHVVGPLFRQQRLGAHVISQVLPAGWSQGLASANTTVLHEFEDFLRNVSGETPWQDRPTWLIDTGDGTTFGDSESLDLWLRHWSPRFLAAAGRRAAQRILYGNHDAWPGRFPLLAPKGMHRQWTMLRTQYFQDLLPAPPLTAALVRGSGSEVQLYALNSVDHDLWANAAARGLAVPDHTPQQSNPGPTASDDLDRLASIAAVGGPHLRLLAMHYPVAAVASTSRVLEILANRDQFAADLAAARHVCQPLVHLLVAGHTHTSFPGIGLAPNGLQSVRDAPLRAGFAQLVSGSVSQMIAGTNGAVHSDYYPEQCAQDFPYQCTLLRIYAESTASGIEVTVERTLVGCPDGGSFASLPIAEGSTRVHESLTLVLG